MNQLAAQQPRRAEHLRALCAAARKQAAREQRWLEDHPHLGLLNEGTLTKHGLERHPTWHIAGALRLTNSIACSANSFLASAEGTGCRWYAPGITEMTEPGWLAHPAPAHVVPAGCRVSARSGVVPGFPYPGASVLPGRGNRPPSGNARLRRRRRAGYRSAGIWSHRRPGRPACSSGKSSSGPARRRRSCPACACTPGRAPRSGNR